MKANWTPADIPDLSGKVAIVTGSNVGLGLEIATQLAGKNVYVYLACRTPAKAESAKAGILEEHPNARVEILKLDVSSFASVRAVADAFITAHDRLDILMCNAGIMAPDKRGESVDGPESQFATNHLGHFLLCTLLHPLLSKTDGSRVVTQSSSANWFGKFDFDDLDAKKKYSPWDQYCMTKLANVAFANEYNSRINDEEKNPKVFSVHPGLVVGQLQANQAGDSWLYNWAYKISGALLAGTYETGARPALYACAEPSAKVGEFYGPTGWFKGMGGKHPTVLEPNKIAADREATKKLWELSEESTGVKFEV